MNAFGLFEALRLAAVAKRQKQPLLALISCSAKEAEGKAAGGDGCFFGGIRMYKVFVYSSFVI